MIENKPYIFLQNMNQEKHGEYRTNEYVFNISIKLKGKKIIDEPKIVENSGYNGYYQGVTKHDNHYRTHRADWNQYYSPKLKRSIVKIHLVDSDGNEELWHRPVKIPFDKVGDMKPYDEGIKSFHSDMVQVLLYIDKQKADHDGSSVGHYGDAD